MLNLGLAVVPMPDNTIEVEIPMHKLTLGKNHPSDYFIQHLQALLEEFNFELTKTKTFVSSVISP